MGYLIAQIAIYLFFAALLGLLLGWLLWGYMARQRALEVQTLRERLTDLSVATQRRAITSGPQAALPETQQALIEADLPAASAEPEAFFEQSEEEPLAEAFETAKPLVVEAAPRVAPDLEAEVKQARIQHLEQQVRELEGARDRLQLLQADLSDALAGRRAAEAKAQELKSDFEVRSSGLLAQIRDFENAASEWDQTRDELERTAIAREKELSTVKAHLRDLQNSQRPQVAEPIAAAPTAAAIELADLRDRHQRALKERDALASELEFWKQNDSTRTGDSVQMNARVADLEESLKAKDAKLQEQVARIESLLWRVAELEPFAAAAPKMEEDLRRHQSEIAGHMAMHQESGERMRSLQSRVAELETEAKDAQELRKTLAAQQADWSRLSETHAQEMEEARQSAREKDALAATQVAALQEHAQTISALKGRVSELEAALERAASAEASLKAKEEEMQRLAQEHEARVAEIQQSNQQALGEKEGQLGGLRQSLAEKVAEHSAAVDEHGKAVTRLQVRVGELEAAESLLRGRESELSQLRESMTAKDREIAEHTAARSEQVKTISALQARAGELEIAGQRAAALEKTLSDRDTEIRGLFSAHGDMQREMQGWKDYAAQLQPLASQLPSLESLLSEREAEIARLREADKGKEDQLKYLQQRVEVLSARLAAHRQRLDELEPLAAKVPDVEQQLTQKEQALKETEERHQAELTRLKVNSAQRLKRLRQGITNFKG